MMWDTRAASTRLMAVNCSLLLLLVPLVIPIETARAENVVQNDSLVAGSQGFIVAGFVANDVGAAVFELPEGTDAFKINRVQVLVLSDPPGALHTFTSIHLYCSGLPDPGAAVKTIGGYGLTPDYLNEINVSNEGWLVQI